MITAELATDFGTAYELMSSKISSDKKDDDEVVKLPKLEAKSWPDWQDKLLLKLQGEKAKNSFLWNI